MKFGQSVSNQPLTPGSGMNREKKLSPNAKDHADCVSPSNELKQYVGKNGKPSEPFGKKGKNF